MKKKTIIFIVSFGFLLIFSIIIFLLLKANNNKLEQEQLEAITNDASIILNIIRKDEFIEISKSNYQLQELQKNLQLTSIIEKLKLLDTIENNINLSEDLMKNENIILALYYNSQIIEQQLILKIRNKNEKYFFKNLENQLNNNKKVNQIEINNTKVLEYCDADKLYFYVKNSLFIISDSKALIEKTIAIQNGEFENILQDISFKKSYKSAGKNELANLYINFGKEKNNKIINSNNEAFKFISELQNNWQEYDINISDNSLICNGISFIDENNINLLYDYIRKTDNSKFEILSMIPNSCSSFLAYKYRKDTLIKTSSELINNILKEVKSEISILRNDINKFIIFDCISSQNSEKNILLLFNKFSKTKNIIKLENDVLNIDSKISVNCIKIPNDLDSLYDSVFFPVEAKYCCFYNNYVIFSENISSLRLYILDNIRRNTLINDKSYIKFSKLFTKKSNLFYYCRNENFQYGYEISKISNNYYNLFSIDQYSDNNLNTVIWQSKLESDLINDIFEVKNHNDLSSEYIFQDENLNLYLIDNMGIILWQKPFYEKIIGVISQIDYYENGKLQYIFSTEKKIYIIDRLGNYVENYPISLSSETNNSLSVVKYKDNKQSRLIIPCKDRKLYLFDIQGKVLKDWLFPQSESEILSRVKHFVIEDKDYLCINDIHNIYMYSRKGELRVSYFFEEGISNNEIYLDEKSKELLITTLDGKIMRINIVNNKKSSLSLKSFSEKHYFNYIDIDGDKENDFVFSDSTNIYVYGKKGNLIFRKDINNEIEKIIIFNKLKGNLFIGVLCENGNTFVLNGKGEILKNFPILGIRSILIIEEENKYYYLSGGIENIISKNRLILE